MSSAGDSSAMGESSSYRQLSSGKADSSRHRRMSSPSLALVCRRECLPFSSDGKLSLPGNQIVQIGFQLPHGR